MRIPQSLRPLALSLVGLLIAFMAVLVVAQSSPRIAKNQPSTFPGLQDLRATAAVPMPLVATAPPPVSFGLVVAYSADIYPTSVAIGDVNGDGHPDLVVANGPRSRVNVLLGKGDGTFQSPAGYTLGAGGGSLSFVAIADLNEDGHLDLVVSDAAWSQIDVLLGNGDGTFQGPVSYRSGGNSPPSVAISDVNGDGHPDLVVANKCQSSTNCDIATGFSPGGVSVLLGNGDGTFQEPVAYSSGGYLAQSVTIGDLNGDGHPDLVVTSSCQSSSACDFYTSSGPGGVSVLLGKGDGTFQAPVSYSSGGLGANSVAIGDLNRDGHPDLVVANMCQNGNICPWNGLPGEVSVLLGNGEGTFQAPVGYPAGGVPVSVAIRDVNGDGNPDLVVADWCPINNSTCKPGAVSIHLGNGDGTFQPPVSRSSGGAYTACVAVADLNGDGRPDLVAANFYSNSVGVLLNRTYYGSTTQVTTSGSPSFVHQPVAFTATITPPPFPDGQTVTFYDGATAIGSSSIASGVATLTTSSLSDKTHTIKATYPGDIFEKASSATVMQAVNRYTSTTTLRSSLNPSIFGQKVSWTATVTTPGAFPPTGTVAFTWSNGFGTFTIGSAVLNASGIAAFSKSNLNAYPYPLTAVYRGDADNTPGTSPVLNQTVLQTTSAAALTSSVNPSTAGQTITFTAKVTSPTVMPSGPVTFKAGTTVLATVQLSSGKAIFKTSTLPAGSTVVKVIYDGNSNIKGSSASLTQTVQP